VLTYQSHLIMCWRHCMTTKTRNDFYYRKADIFRPLVMLEMYNYLVCPHYEYEYLSNTEVLYRGQMPQKRRCKWLLQQDVTDINTNLKLMNKINSKLTNCSGFTKAKLTIFTNFSHAHLIKPSWQMHQLLLVIETQLHLCVNNSKRTLNRYWPQYHLHWC